MRAIIFLRSYGDFTIAISVLRRADLTNWKLYASVHLQPLYEDLKKNDPAFNLPIEFVDFGIKHKILSWFTNKFLFSAGAFLEASTLASWRKQLPRSIELYLEQHKRAWLLSFFFGGFKNYIHTGGNVYESYQKMFLTGRETASQNEPHALLAVQHLRESSSSGNNSPAVPSAVRKILILPESRKPSKEIPLSFIEQVAATIQQAKSMQVASTSAKQASVATQPASASLENKCPELTVAYFKNIPQSATLLTQQNIALKTHTAFLDLIKLISEADLVITADSLPAHLCEFLAKPHFIYFAGKPSKEWLTPFARKYNSFASIGNTQPLLNFLNA